VVPGRVDHDAERDSRVHSTSFSREIHGTAVVRKVRPVGVVLRVRVVFFIVTSCGTADTEIDTSKNVSEEDDKEGVRGWL